MPTKADDLPENPADGKTVLSPVAPNGMDEAALKSAISEIEDENIAIDAIMKNARERAQGHKDAIKTIFKKAATAGVPKEPLRAFMKSRSLQRDLDTVADTLNDNGKAHFAEIQAKAGDMSLWKDEPEDEGDDKKSEG